jgi:hypothetical protein
MGVQLVYNGSTFLKKGVVMTKEKRLKKKRVMVRVTDELYQALTEYVEEKNTTKTKVIEDFLKHLLKDKIR